MAEIDDFTFSYSLVRGYVMFAFKRFFSKYIVLGRENLPKEGPVILAVNHLNALMDALAVISVVPHKMPVIFLARSDYFNNKTIAKFLKFCKIMPAFRMREGIENIDKNNIVFDKCVEILHHNKAIGIMPEGNQGSQRKIRPLAKGIFRIAFQAQEKYDSQPGVKIVPIGIDWGNIDKYGEHVIINIGKPIEVANYMSEYEENPVTAINKIRDELKNRLSELTLDIATHENYNCFETATKVANAAMVEKLQLPNKEPFRFFARQKTAQRLLELEQTHPELVEKLTMLCKEYNENLKKLNLPSWLFNKTIKTSSLVLESLLLIISFPFFLIGFILNLLPFFTPDLIINAFHLNFPGGRGSLRFGIGLVTFPLFYILQAILFYKKLKATWWATILFFPLQYYFGKFAFFWHKEFKKLKAKIQYLTLKVRQSIVLERTKFLHDQIIHLIEI